MSDILDARDRTGRRVVIKRLKEGLSRDPEIVARFEREGRTVSAISHKNVVKVFEFGVEGDRPYIVMERLDGQDLGDLLKDRGPLGLDEAAALAAQACQGMIVAHDAGLVHRDLKPGNLFVAKEGDATVVKVLDFGITKLTKGPGDGQITLTQHVFGSPLYMPPESFKSAKHADVRSDIWSLGIIFYEMLTGVTPFMADNALSVGFLVTREDFIAPSMKRAGIPRSVDVVIGRALKKEPGERYQSMRELLAAMEVFMPRGRNDTMTVAQVVDPPMSDAQRTALMNESVTRFGMMTPGSYPSIQVDQATFDAPTRVAEVSDPHDVPTRVAQHSDPMGSPTSVMPPPDDDELDAPTRMRSDTAAVMQRALGYKMVPILAEPETDEARVSTVGETGRIAGPVSMSTPPPALAVAQKKKLSPVIWAVPAAAALFGVVGWLVGRAPDAPAKNTAATPVASEVAMSDPPPQPIDQATAPESASVASEASAVVAEPSATASADSVAPDPSADPAASAAPKAATPLRAPTKPPPKKKKKFQPQSI